MTVPRSPAIDDVHSECTVSEGGAGGRRTDRPAAGRARVPRLAHPAGSSATAAACAGPGRRARPRCGASSSGPSPGTACATNTPARPGCPSARRGPPPMHRPAWCEPPTSSTPTHRAPALEAGTGPSPARGEAPWRGRSKETDDRSGNGFPGCAAGPVTRLRRSPERGVPGPLRTVMSRRARPGAGWSPRPCGDPSGRTCSRARSPVCARHPGTPRRPNPRDG